MKRAIFTLLMLLIVAASSFAKTYKVTASKLNVRNAPDKSGQVIGSVTQDMEVEVVSISDGWAEIKYKGKTAYISAQYITPVKKSSSSQSSQSTSGKTSSQSSTSGASASSGSSKADKSDKKGKGGSSIDKPLIGGFHITLGSLFTGRSLWNKPSQIDPTTGKDMGLWDYTKLGTKGNNVYGLSIGIGFEYNHIVYSTAKANIMVGFRTGLYYDWCGSVAKKLSTPSSEGWLPDEYHRSRISVHSLTIPLQPMLSFEIPTGRKSIGFGVFTGPIFETFLGFDQIELAFKDLSFSFLIINNITGKVAYLIGGDGSSYELPESQRAGVFNCMWGTGAFVQFGRLRITASTDWGIHNYSLVKGNETTKKGHVDGHWNRFITVGFQIVLL